MSFAKNVNKYYKWVLGSIVGIMALSLVVSGNVRFQGRNPDKIKATIFNSIPVTEKDWYEANQKAGAWFRLKIIQEYDDSTDPQKQQYQGYLFEMRGRPGLLATVPQFKPNQDDLRACAQELIVLGYDAKTKQVRVSDQEVEDVLNGYLHRGGVDAKDVDAQAEFASVYFLSSTEALIGAVRDSLLIQKSLALEVGGCNTRYEDVYGEKLAGSRSVRVLVASIDGDKLPLEIRPVTDEDIREKFETDRANYKMPAKIQVEYLFASFDEFKSKMAEPTEDEIKKYYEERKQDFVKPSKLEMGHSDTESKEYKLLDEVRDEVIKKIKDRNATRQADALIKRVSTTEFATRWYKLLAEEGEKEPKDKKAVRDRAFARTGSLFAEIRDALKAENLSIKNGITLPIAKEDRDALTQELGKAATTGDRTDSLEWAFNASAGEVGNQIYRSDKGYALLRVANKIEGYQTDLTAPIREKIRQDLLSQEPAARARRLADELERRIRKDGKSEIEKLRARTDLTVQRSLYMNQSTSDSESGLTPPVLAQQVKSRFLNKKDSGMPPPTTESLVETYVVTGADVGGDRKDWCYVIVVDDSVQVAPDLRDEEFMSDVVRRETLAVTRAREERLALIMKTADWRDSDGPPRQED